MEKNLRIATIEDAPFIMEMIKELALYEKAPEQVSLSLEQLKADGFGQNPLYKCLILELDKNQVGICLYYYRYSTWKGKALYLEDLYIQPDFRGHGLGLMAMKKLANIAHEGKCQRFEWQVLDWNEPSIKFYERIGSKLDGEWINCKFEEDGIRQFAKS